MTKEKNLELVRDKRVELAALSEDLYFSSPLFKLVDKLDEIYPEDEFVEDYYLSDKEDLIIKIIVLKLKLLENKLNKLHF